jgi:hypothetical protein
MPDNAVRRWVGGTEMGWTGGQGGHGGREIHHGSNRDGPGRVASGCTVGVD